MSEETRILTLINCKDCPNCETKRTPMTGYAVDYYCKAADNQTIKGYVERPDEEPKDNEFPSFCPLPKGRKKK